MIEEIPDWKKVIVKQLWSKYFTSANFAKTYDRMNILPGASRKMSMKLCVPEDQAFLDSRQILLFLAQYRAQKRHLTHT